MAYVKQNWECGEMITADKLNHMEDGIANAGGDCDCGFECDETKTLLTNETVTTAVNPEFPEGAPGGSFSYSQLIDADTIVVTFNGTEYECPHLADNQTAYGAPYDDVADDFDWSEYPFAISSAYSPITQRTDNYLITETAGAYAIKIEAVTRSATTTACFKAAVTSVVEPLIPTVNTPLVVSATKTPSTGTEVDPSAINTPLAVIKVAMKQRGVVVEDSAGRLYTVVTATQEGIVLEGIGAGGVIVPYYYQYTSDPMGALYYPIRVS